MVIITGTARLGDAVDAREQMVPAVQAMVEATRAEPGCEGIHYSFDIVDPDVMVFHEIYDSMESLQAHMQSPHMRAFYDAAGGLMAGRPDVSMWVGAEKGQMGPG